MFKSQKEKHAYKQGIKKGRKGGTVWYSRKKSKKTKSKTPQKPKKKHPGDDFERTSSGRIKGSYTVDGFFEPD